MPTTTTTMTAAAWAWCLTCALAAVTAALVYYLCTCTLDKWRRLGVPYVRPVRPLFGNFAAVALGAQHPAQFYRNAYYKLSGHRYGGVYQMRTPYLMLRDPALVHAVFVRDFSSFSDRGVYSDFAVNPMSDHLFFMDNPRWKTMRNKLTPAFTSGRLKTMYEQIRECGHVLMREIDASLCRARGEGEGEGGSLDVREALGKYATDVIGTCAFGLRLNTVCDDDSPFRRYGRSLFVPSVKVLLRELCLMVSPKLLRVFRIQDFPPDAVEFFRSALHDTLKYREDNGIVRNDFVNVLMQARKDLVLDEKLPAKERFTEIQIVANAFVMFAAGFETTSSILSYCLYELALKKPIQDKLRDFIKSKLAKNNGEINNEFLLDLEYLDMVIAETLRKYPVFYALFRKAVKTYQVPDDSLVIEKGQGVILPIQSLHYDPKYYPDPETFDPERFSPEEKAKRVNGTYFPFGDGPRMCIGKRFSEMEMRLALVEILTKYEAEPCEKTQVPLTYSKKSLLMNPEFGIWLRLKLHTPLETSCVK